MSIPIIALNYSWKNRLAVINRGMLLAWEKPLQSGLLMMLIFLGLASLKGVPWRLSLTPYFNYLADAFVHGQLHLRIVPSFIQDLSLYQGNYYLYWGPMPALIISPLVAIFGVQVSDILQNVVFGGINTGLFCYLLRIIVRQEWIILSTEQRALLVLFFAMGTAMTPLATVGNVGYLLTLETITFCLLCFIAAFSFKNERAFFWTGCAVGGVMLSRISAIFITIFLAWYLIRNHSHLGLRRLMKLCAIGVVPVIIVVGLMASYNMLRFGHPLDNGINYHLISEGLKESLRTYGLFSLHYLPINFYLGYLHYPLKNILQGEISIFGGSILLLSPLFFAGIYALWRDRKDADTWLLLFSFLLGNIPALIIIAPGSIHFGPRYLLDPVLPLLLLTARGIREWPFWLVTLLLLISVIHYLIGALAIIYCGYFP